MTKTYKKKQDYSQFLRSMLGEKAKQYTGLLHTLESMEFLYIIPNDENRASDGLALRTLFFYAPTANTPPCNVLEMLLALAIRMAYEVTDGQDESLYFWLLIDNLGLTSQTDETFNESKIRTRITRFLERTYNPNGSGGGLFPLKKPRGDLREIEIWYQMQAFIAEKYPI